MLGPVWEVDMSKKCTPLRREAHFQVKMLKARHAQTTLKVQMWFLHVFAWQARGIAHLAKSGQRVRVL
jgi:hypothetical protein